MVLKINKKRRDFLWLGVGECKIDHVINWDLVCKSKVEVGLGFGKFL